MASHPPLLITEALWYCAMGSGQFIVDPFLALMCRVFWHKGSPTCQDAVFAVTWALQHAIEVNPGGINEPHRLAMLTLQADGQLQAHMLNGNEIAEHQQNVEGACAHLREYEDILRGKREAPNIPKP